MEAIKETIKTVLQNLTEAMLEQVVDKLERDGVETVQDLEYVSAEDLTGILKPIEIRKLLKSWTTANAVITSTPDQMTAIAQMSPAVCNPSTTEQHDTPRAALAVTRSDPSWPHKFLVPWGYLPGDVKQALVKGERLVGKQRKTLIHMVVDAVQAVCRTPRKNQLTIIAKKVYDKYPHAVTDQLNGSVIGTGYETFTRQLVNRTENKNRESSNPLRRSLNTSFEEGETCPTSNSAKKRKEKDSYGCINWQPTLSEVDRENMLTLQANMRQLTYMDADIITASIEETYPLQRTDINSQKSMAELLEDWPLLCSNQIGLLCHFQLLTGINIKEKMTQSFKEKASRILAYSQHGIKSDKVRKLCLRVLKDLKHATEVENSARPTILAVILLLMGHFEEQETGLFQLVDEHTTASELRLENSPASPLLVACGDSLLLANRYMLVVDKVVIIEYISSALCGLTLLFAAFYCFNVEYPEGAAATLEFIQRCFVAINPDTGSKVCSSKKKNSSMNNKVLTLIGALADFEWANAGLD